MNTVAFMKGYMHKTATDGSIHAPNNVKAHSALKDSITKHYRGNGIDVTGVDIKDTPPATRPDNLKKVIKNLQPKKMPSKQLPSKPMTPLETQGIIK